MKSCFFSGKEIRFPETERVCPVSRFFAVFTRMLAVFRPLKSLRIPAREASRFRDGSVQWSWHGIPVAVRRNDGRLVYLKWSRRMVFRVPEPEEGGA